MVLQVVEVSQIIKYSNSFIPVHLSCCAVDESLYFQLLFDSLVAGV